MFLFIEDIKFNKTESNEFMIGIYWHNSKIITWIYRI